MPNTRRTPRHGWPLLAVCAVSLAMLLPFLNKAFHVDDTLFLYAARQIAADPLRPYDVTLNWNGTEERMWEVTKNPPLASYYIAAIAAGFGQHELALHAAFLLWPLLTVVSVYWLAVRMGAAPGWSAALLACSPAFLVAATGVSSDLMALSLYVFAVAAFVHGSQENRSGWLVLSGVAAGLSAVTKYIGLTVIPLLAAYSVLREKKLSPRLLVLLIALAIFGVWAAHGVYFYGKAHFLTAATYASEIRSGAPEQWSVIVLRRFYFVIATAAFLAAGLGPVVLLSVPLLQRRRAAWLVAGVMACAAVAVMIPIGRAFELPTRGAAHLALVAVLVGAAALFVWSAFRSEKGWPAERLLAVLWLCGVLVFSAFLNWTVALRVLLFAVPPAALLLGRAAAARRLTVRSLAPATLLSAALAVWVVAADARWANAYRRVARELVVQPHSNSAQTYFHCHWGLQYYLEQAGWRFFSSGTTLHRGDKLLVAPVALRSQGLQEFIESRLAGGRLRQSAAWQIEPLLGLHTQNRWAGAGLYSAADGPLPYALSSRPCESLRLYEVP